MDGLVGLFLVCGVIYYFLGRRATDMVDVIQNRLTEVYSSWDGSTDQANASSRTLSTTELRRAGLSLRNRAAKNKEIARAVRSSSLYQIKETEITVPDPAKNSSFVYYCCNRCTPHSRDSFAAQAAKQNQNGITNLLIADPQPKNIWSKLFSHTYHVYGFKKYDYPQVSRTVSNDERIKDAIKETAAETVRETGCSEDEAMRRSEARAKSVLERMQSGLSDLMLRFTAWTLYKLLPCFIRSAAIQTRHLDMLHEASEQQLPLVFMPLHRSHLDYVMISFLTLTNNIRSPLVAAGDNLRIPLFGWLMSGLGAFFIKRRMDPVVGRRDLIYRATLQTYIMESLRAGHNLEFFIEGGRSRTGKPCQPKGGILSVVVDAYVEGTIEDALIVPVSMNYERLVDGNFVREQLGQPKKMETFGSTLRAMWNTLRGSYGIVKLEVCQPFSLREMVMSFQLASQPKTIVSPAERQLKATMSTSSLYGTDCVSEDLRQVVDKIAMHVVYDCSKSTPVMSTNVVAFLLLNKFRDGCSMEQLVEAVDSLRAELRNAKRDVAFCGESVDIVNHALDILGPGLVKMERQEVTDTINGKLMKRQVVVQVRPIAILPNVIETAYYANTLLVHYVVDSVVITALYAALRTQINSPQAIAANNLTVTHEELMENALAICDILKHEFIFCRPCQTLEDCINQAVDRIKADGIIVVPSEGLLEEEIWSRRFAKTLECESEEEEDFSAKKIRYKLRLEKEYSDRMEFLHTLLRPLIDTYVFSAYTLRRLVGKPMEEREFVQLILSEIKSNIDTGIVNYGESLCVDPIKNSLKLFEKKNILECHVQKNVKIYYLKEEFDDDEAVNQIYETLSTFKWIRNID